MGCGCARVLEWLRARGATHAAEMHADPDRAWTAEDWRRHFAEEQRHLFPLLPAWRAEELAAEHRVFLHELARFGRIVSTARLAAHAALEDRLFAALARDDAA